MKRFKYKSLKEFANNFDFENFGKEDLIISDIDGVFFKGVYDPREIIGVIKKENLHILETFLKMNCGFWIFTNRKKFFRNFPFIKQLQNTLSNHSQSKVNIFLGSNDYLEHKIQKYAVIINSAKPGNKSQEVVGKGIDNFRKVIYIGSQDTPFFYTDKKLVDNLSKKKDLSKLVFVEINSWKRNSQ